jgi:hypothetical protein
LLARASAPLLDVLVGEAASPVYDARHARAVVFIGGEYWIVADYLTASRQHTYHLRWHLSPAAGVGLAVRPDEGVVDTNLVTLAFASESPRSGHAGPSRRPHVEPGWYAPLYGTKYPAPVVVLETLAESMAMCTGVKPRRGNPSHFRLRVLTQGDWPSRLTTVEVSGVGAAGQERDLVTWTTEPNPVELAGFRGRARAAWVRFDASSRAVAFGASDLIEGSWYGTELAVRPGDGTGRYVSWQKGESLPTIGSGAL